ncbi:hypothetical protein HPP92_010669 [Vanilla planifolia]|uniref:Calponin-homology (CH) domain-containing protein n=1 Tax=Vanilla planifolia TaxID=51239 RepID=A0A835QUC4_VANPL|nr:hypothetical protein HPP92_010669 [Vanilla planifolia]
MELKTGVEGDQVFLKPVISWDWEEGWKGWRRRGFFSIFVESVVEDVIKQHGNRPSDIDMASRRAEEAAARRYEAAAWLRRTVGVVGAKDLPEEPSEEEFRIGLRNGIILCNALNKVQPGAIQKVVEAPPDSFVVPDGAPLTAYQYFENLRNFLVTLEGMGLSTFEASDLERGGKGSRVVDSVLALKFYIEAKQAVRTVLSNKKPEEVPLVSLPISCPVYVKQYVIHMK